MSEYPIPIDSRDFVDPTTDRDPRRPQAHDAQRSEREAKRTTSVDQLTYGVKKLSVENAAGRRSASYTLHNDVIIASRGAERVCFVPRDPATPVPRAGGEDLIIRWELRYAELIRSARLEIFVRGNAAPIWTRDLIWEGGQLVPVHDPLPPPPTAWSKQGQLVWDGCLDAPPPGATTEACVGVADSPYKLKMTVTGTDAAAGARRSPAEAWTYFDVLVKKLALSWGNTPEAKSVIPENRPDVAVPWQPKVLLLEQAILDALHPQPITQDQTIYLRSDLFTTSFNDESNTDAPYRAYREKWGQGPLIPLFARLFVESAAGGAVSDAPWALDGAKVLWDWEDRGGDKAADWLNAETPATKDFVKGALDYYVKLHAEQGHAPRGSNNCHLDHGGKRGPLAPSVFPQQTPASYTAATAAILPREFPFQVDPCPAPRPWASTSVPRTRGVLAGYTGALFQPSRMAGDCFRVSAYLALDGFPYGDDAATLRVSQPAPLRKSTGMFEVRRKLQARILRKTGGAPDLAGNTAHDIYEAAGVELEVVSNAVLAPLAWEAAFDNQIGTLRINNAVNGADPWFFGKRALYAAGPDCVFGDQKVTADGVTFRDRAALHPPMPGDWDQFYTGGIGGPGSQTSSCASNILSLVQREYVDTSFPGNVNPALDVEGVFVFLFRYRSAYWRDQLEGAANSSISVRTRAIVNIAYEPGTPSRQVANYGPGAAVKGFDEVLAHEIGHALWLPHATALVDAKARVHLPHEPPGVAPGHDTDDSCLMNYHPNGTRFCGVCNLRLRGWSVRGSAEGANAPEALVELFNAPNKNRRSFKLTRCTVSVPATPPKTKRLMFGSDTDFNVMDRTQKDVISDDADLAANPALVLLANTVVETPGLVDPACDAAAQPIKLTCVVAEAPAGSRVVWKVVRHGDDDPGIAKQSAKALPSLTVHGDGTATLLADAVGTFAVKCSVNVDGKVTFDDTLDCLVVNVVIVKVSRDKSDHRFADGDIVVSPVLVGGDVKLGTAAGRRSPMSVRTRVRLLGGGPDGRRGLDKVQGGWINNMLVEDTQVEYVDPHDAVQWRARTFILHRRADHALEALVPAMDPAHPLVDKHTTGGIAAWVPRKAVLSAANPSPATTLDTAPGTDLALGREVWIGAEDGPEQGWDEHPPTQPGFTLARFNLDLEFRAYLCFWTDDARTLAGVLEEVPWEMHAGARRDGRGGYRLDGKARIRELPKTKHEELVPALTTGVETCPPGTVQVSSVPRNVVHGQPVGTDWGTGLP